MQHWRTAALPSASPDFNTLVAKWLDEPRGCFLGNCYNKIYRPTIHKFFNSLMHYSQEGTFPPKHINWRLRS